MNTLQEKLRSERMVAISVEPGGSTKNGSLGLSEIVGDEVQNTFYMRFWSPLGRGGRVPTAEKEIAEIAEAHKYYYGEEGPEHKIPTFPEAWMYADAFVGDSVVTTYGQNPDVNALRRLVSATHMEIPDYLVIDGKTALMNHLQQKPGSLQEVALKYILDRVEIEERKELAYSGAQEISNWTLHNTAHKADIAAKIFTKVIYPQRGITLPQILPELSMNAYSLRNNKPVEL